MTTTQPDRADASTVRDWIERPDPVTVLDVRSPAEFETARIPGSVNVPLNLITNHAGDLAARLDRQVVLVCQSGTRATQAQQRLAGAGADHLHILDGGITAYTTAGGDVIRGRARWPLERQVRLLAGILVLAGLALGAAPPEGPAAQRWGRYRAGRVCAHRHLHDGPDLGGAAVQPWSP